MWVKFSDMARATTSVVLFISAKIIEFRPIDSFTVVSRLVGNFGRQSAIPIKGDTVAEN